ncbi:MAG: oligoribonuclease [Polyangiales bacterium]
MGRGFLWFDSEFSTDDLDHASLLQVAAIATDEQLRVLRPEPLEGLQPDEARPLGTCILVRPPDDVVVSEFVRKNQAEVLADAQRRGRAAADVDRLLAARVDAQFGAPGEPHTRPTLAGNSIHIDWLLLRRHLPQLARRLHYRVLDVTALKIEWSVAHGGPKGDKADPARSRAHFPDADLPGGAARHDAYYDAQASIAELASYRAGLGRRASGAP